MVGLISIPVTLGLPLPTARRTSTPPPGPIMANSPRGRSTLARDGAADMRLVFQLNAGFFGRPVFGGVGFGGWASSQPAGSMPLNALGASAAIQTICTHSWLLPVH